MFPFPALSCVPPQLLQDLLAVLRGLLHCGHAEAAAHLALAAFPSLPPSSAPSIPAHVCPLSFPPPPPSLRRRRRRRRRRRSVEPAGSTISSSSLSSDVDSIVSSILVLPVTSVVEEEEQLLNQDLQWDDIFTTETKEELRVGEKEEEEEKFETNEKDELPTQEEEVKGANIVASLLEEMLISAVAMEVMEVEVKGEVEMSEMQDQWVDSLVTVINNLEAKYTPHPLPYEDPPGVIHSADVHPPYVDFTAMGFNSRRLPTPELHPIYGCSPNSSHQYKDFPYGALPGLLTNGGVITVPHQLFGFEYVSGTGRGTVWAMQAC